MCGLVGQAGKLEYRDEAIHKRLLLLDYGRGPDSTGSASIRKNGEVKIAKIASHPIDLFDTARFKSAIIGSQSTVLIGHNRAATKGAVNTVNAHPFQYGHIVGAHNGTLSLASFNDLQDKLGEKFDVDSQAIFASIARFGLKDTISMLTGAWSLVYYDLEKKTLNWLRNKERPLWFAYSKDFTQVIWASEWQMIEPAVKLTDGRTSASSFDLHSEEKDDKIVKFWSTAENIHYAFDIEKLIEGKGKPKPKCVELKGKEVPTREANSCGYHDPFGRNNGTHQSTGGTHSTTTFRGGNDDKLPEVVHLLGLASDPFAGVISKEKFEELAQYGCSWCSDNVEWGQAGVLIFERDDVLLCPSCSRKDESQVFVSDIKAFL